MKHHFLTCIIFLAASVAANAQDFELSNDVDATPDGQVVFNLVVPYQLNDVHPDAAGFLLQCSTGFDGSAPPFRRDLRTEPISASGFRNISGEATFAFTLNVTLASMQNLSEDRYGYRCNASLSPDPARPVLGTGGRVIHGDTAAGADAPYWARGTGSGSFSSGAVNGNFVLNEE